MIPRSLQHRIVIVFVGLLLLVTAIVISLVSQSSRRIVRVETARELEAGSHVFLRMQEQNRRQLETAARVLAGDFAFREAIATQDRPTVHSAIRNHSLRIGAQAMMVVDPAGQMLADTRGGPAQEFPFTDLLERARRDGHASGFGQMADGLVYQIVLIPIQAPRLLAWVAMGFQVDDRWARDLSEMIGLTISVVRAPQRQPTVLASSLAGPRRASLLTALPRLAGGGSHVLALDGEHFQSRLLPLNEEISVVLQRSLEQVQEPFDTLQAALLLTLLGGIAVFGAGSVMLARRIVRPVRELTAAAQRIEAGDYSLAVPRLPPDEIGHLAASFDHMREGIASREEKILRLAYEDTLTGLANRTRFVEVLAQALRQGSGAVMLLHIDRFSKINSALGHPVGDRLLQAIGQRLRRLAPDPLLLARPWGNEYAILLPAADRDTATAFAHAVLTQLRDPMTLENQRLDINGSLGIALYPQDGNDVTTLLQRAELALAQAKRLHQAIAFAADAGEEPAHEQLSLIGEMREALDRSEFLLYYQPKMALANHRIVGAEALLRWRHPQRGMLAPGGFLPFAEQTGFIREITPWLLTQAVTQTAQWHHAGLDLTISANLSALDLQAPALVEQVRHLLAQHALPPRKLCLEITESALMDDPELALDHLHQLSALGVKLSIDDYGSGQASLAYLKTLPVNELKIDRAFVTGIDTAPKNAAIVRSTILLSHELGLSVTAEGVETDSECLWLARNGCDVVQGYGISVPLPADELPRWIAARTATA